MDENAAQSLVHFLGAEALPYLLQLSADPNYEVRRTASAFPIPAWRRSRAGVPG